MPSFTANSAPQQLMVAAFKGSQADLVSAHRCGANKTRLKFAP
jgi:hypothetical protein